MARNFRDLIEVRWAEGKFVCVGLDSEYEKIPEHLRASGNVVEALLHFNKGIVDATKDRVCAYKPNAAFYEALGDVGWLALRETIVYIRTVAPEVPVIWDAKRADIGNTNLGYVKEAFEFLRADAITVHPFLGGEALQPFLDQKDKGIFVLCRTSNPGAGEFQGLTVAISMEEARYLHSVKVGYTVDSNGSRAFTSLSNHVAYQVSQSQRWNANGNCGLVVGATYPDELRDARKIAGDMPILIPGIGAQGGDTEKTVRAGKDSRGRGMIINSSRGIIFASNGEDCFEAARRETIRTSEGIGAFLEKGVSE